MAGTSSRGGVALAVALVLGALVAPRAGRGQSIFEGDVPSEELNRAVDLEEVKTDLALCAPHLTQLEGGADPQALADTVEDPACRKAILKAQAAGLSKAQIVDLLMGASDAPDPDELTMPHDGPPVVVR